MEDNTSELVDELIDSLDDGLVAYWAQAVIRAAWRENAGDRKAWAIDVEFAFVTFLEQNYDKLSMLSDDECQRVIDAMQNVLVTEAYFADCPIKMQPRGTTYEA